VVETGFTRAHDDNGGKKKKKKISACCLVHWHPGKQLCDLAALPHNHDGIGSSTKSTLEKDDIPILNFGGQPFYYYYSLVTYFLNTDFF